MPTPRLWTAGAAKAYARTFERAYRQVPYYREQWAAAGTGSPVPVPVPAAALTAHHRFVPLGATATEGGPHPAAELYESLMVSERYAPDDTLFDVQRGLRDRSTIAPRRRGRYQVLLSHDADIDPHIDVDPRRAAIEAYRSSSRPVLLADEPQLAGLRELAPELGLPPVRSGSAEPDRPDLDSPRTAPDTEVHRPGPEAAATGHTGEVLVRGDLTRLSRLDILCEPALGYLGARRRSCGLVHLNRRGVDVRMLADSLVFTRTDRENPTLLHIVPAGAEQTVLDRCPTHDEPILRPVGHDDTSGEDRSG